jgi:hypothetical protein
MAGLGVVHLRAELRILAEAQRVSSHRILPLPILLHHVSPHRTLPHRILLLRMQSLRIPPSGTSPRRTLTLPPISPLARSIFPGRP